MGSMGVNGRLVVSRIAKMMLDRRRIDSFGKAYLSLMKSDATLHFSMCLAESSKMESYLNEMDCMNTKECIKECVKDWIWISLGDNEKVFELDKFDMKLTSTK